MLQGKLYFVYNQQAANGNRKGGKGCEWPLETVKVDRDGRQHQQKIGGLEHTDVLLMPSTGWQAANGYLVFLGGGKRSNRFMKIYIKPEHILTSRHEQE